MSTLKQLVDKEDRRKEAEQIINDFERQIRLTSHTVHTVSETVLERVIKLLRPLAEGRMVDITSMGPSQIHDLCHNLPSTVSRAEFEAGCRAYQDQLYGPKEVEA